LYYKKYQRKVVNPSNIACWRKNGYHGLILAVYREFGSWHKALERASKKPLSRKKWNKEKIIKMLKNPPAKISDPSNSVCWRKNGYGGLTVAAYQEFGSWHKALERAGKKALSRKKWNKEKIIEMLKNLSKKISNPASLVCWRKNGYGGLIGAAIREFKSWNNAKLAVGFETEKSKNFWQEKYRDWEKVKKIIPDLVENIKNPRTLRTLSEKEINDLSEEVQRGNSAAREAMMFTNMRLVYKIVNHYLKIYQYLDLNEEDLTFVATWGNSKNTTGGLVRAIETFDPEKKYKFSTYATYFIKGEISRYIKKKKRDKTRDISYKENLINNYSKTSLRHIEKRIILDSLNKKAKELIKKIEIKERDREIYLLRMKGLTFREIGIRYGLTRERVRQIVEEIKRKIKSDKEIRKYKEILLKL